jgi:2-polyprenyl-3-methyl-5-hydroxy-6-metoxy-1,4-benzoquinol methylase
LNCISCGKDSFSEYCKNSYLGLPINQCQNCGLYITGNSEIDAKEKISKIYEKTYWDIRSSEVSIRSDYTDEDSRGKRRNWISQYSYCKPYLKGKQNLLEIGVGGGQSIFWFEQEGFTVNGIEPDPRNVQLINKKLKHGHCTVGYAEDLEIKEQYDIIWMSHVLEHMIRPDTFLKKIHSNLQKKGIFFIEVPNCENAKMLDSTIPSQPHTFHFTKKSLLKLIENNGYTVLKCDFFRPASKVEGAINKILKKIGIKPYPHYPRILTNNKEGRDLRVIFTSK